MILDISEPIVPNVSFFQVEEGIATLFTFLEQQQSNVKVKPPITDHDPITNM